MSMLITLCVICTVLMLLLQQTAQSRSVPDVISGSKYRYSGLLVVVFFLVVAFISAFRYGYHDTGLYRDICSNMGTDYGRADDEDLAIKDQGFNVLMIFLNRCGFDPQSIIVVTSVVTFAIYIYNLYKYSYDLPFSLFLLVFISYSGMINGIRQVLAGAVLFAAFPFLLRKQWYFYLPFIFLAQSFHASAIVMLPIFFVLCGKRMNIGIFGFCGVIALFFISPSLANSLLGEILQDSTYSGYLDVTATMGFIRLLVAAVPLVLIYFYSSAHPWRPHLKPGSPEYMQQRLADVLINMQIISFGFTALGLQMVFFARISMYFEGAFLLFIPLAIKQSFDRKSSSTIKLMAIFLYFLFFLYSASVNAMYFNDFRLVF